MWSPLLTLLAFLGAAVYAVMSSFKRNFMYFPQKLLHKDPVIQPGYAFALVPCLAGNNIAVYYRKKPDFALPFVLYSHGTMELLEFQTYIFGPALQHMNLIAYDYRGYGRSEGYPTEYATELDMAYLLGWIKHKWPRVNVRDDIVLWGRSIGTNITLKFAGNPERQDILPNRIFLYTPFSRLSDVLKQMGFAAPMLAYCVGNMDVVQCLKTYVGHSKDRKVLISGTEHDSVTPFYNAQELADSVPDDQVWLRKFYGLHTSPFNHWDAFSEFIEATQTVSTEPEVTEDDILESVGALFTDPEYTDTADHDPDSEDTL